VYKSVYYIRDVTQSQMPEPRPKHQRQKVEAKSEADTSFMSARPKAEVSKLNYKPYNNNIVIIIVMFFEGLKK